MKWRDKTKVFPSEECLAQGTKLLCQIDRRGDSHTGAIRSEQGTTLWLFGVRLNTTSRSLKNPFKKPDFVVSKGDASEEVIVRRASFIPPVFQILQANKVIGVIRMVSIFRNKYSISMNGASSWTFRMPLYTINFY